MCRTQLPNEASGMPGRATGQLTTLEQRHICSPAPGQMVRNAHPDNATPNDHNIHLGRNFLAHVDPLGPFVLVVAIYRIETNRGHRVVEHVRVLIIGGGAVGCSCLYHLTALGWTDVILLERNDLTSGSTWHAAGNCPTFSTSWGVLRLQQYSASLYRRLGEQVGYPIN